MRKEQLMEWGNELQKACLYEALILLSFEQLRGGGKVPQLEKSYEISGMERAQEASGISKTCLETLAPPPLCFVTSVKLLTFPESLICKTGSL